MSFKTITRRTLLRGAGGVTLGLPFLEDERRKDAAARGEVVRECDQCPKMRDRGSAADLCRVLREGGRVHQQGRHHPRQQGGGSLRRGPRDRPHQFRGVERRRPQRRKQQRGAPRLPGVDLGQRLHIRREGVRTC